ncbi:MAG: hypothetical protein KCHDKBKB_00997 [Elusimicrobia bacterium]|nr:hypothetical protein [Elusimicrobiota bacterium]
MSKNKKQKKSQPTVNDKAVVDQSNIAADSATPISEKDSRHRMMVRAIRVTPELLEAAKAYKKASGKSFYALGLEAISDRLVREGFLKESTEPKS